MARTNPGSPSLTGTTPPPAWSHTLAKVSLAVAAISLAAQAGAQPFYSDYYVDDDAPPGGDGRSWATAFNDLQDALDAAVDHADQHGYARGYEITIAQGTYTPGRGSKDRLSAFRVKPRSVTSGISFSLNGGYAGIGAPDPNAHDPSAFVSVISADLNGDDKPGFINRADNAKQLIDAGMALGLGLSGFTLHGANASDDATIRGLISNERWDEENRTPSISIQDCLIEENQATPGAAVVRCESGSVSMWYGGVIRNNRAGAIYAGGEVHIYGSSRIEQNSAGAVWAGNNFYLYTSSIESNGGWPSDGAAIHSESYINVYQSLITGNSSVGPTIHSGNTAYIYYSTCAANTSTADVPLIQSDRNVLIAGSILWNNSVGPHGNVGTTSDDVIYVHHSDVQLAQDAIDRRSGQLAWGRGNFDADPLFVDPDGPDDDLSTPDDNNFNLADGSPGIDHGDPNECCSWYDLEGKPAPVDGDGDGEIRPDAGALENQGRPCPADVNHDGLVDGEDLWDFWRAYEYGDVWASYADFNHDGFTSGDDWDAFIEAFEAGC